MAEAKQSKWYILRGISGKEFKVKEMLEAACRNNESIKANLTQILVPTEKVYKTQNGKKVLKEKTLFSGYIFVEANLVGDLEDFLRNTTNVIDFLRSREGGHRPVEVPETEIARMVGAAQAEEQEQENGVPNDYIKGETVKVTSGPFNGFSGEITDVNREKRTLTVSVKVFGRPTPLELDNSQVERE